MKILIFIVIAIITQGCNSDNPTPEVINLQKNCAHVTIGNSDQHLWLCKIFLPRKDGSRGPSSCFVDGGTASFQISCSLLEDIWGK